MVHANGGSGDQRGSGNEYLPGFRIMPMLTSLKGKEDQPDISTILAILEAPIRGAKHRPVIVGIPGNGKTPGTAYKIAVRYVLDSDVEMVAQRIFAAGVEVGLGHVPS